MRTDINIWRESSITLFGVIHYLLLRCGSHVSQLICCHSVAIMKVSNQQLGLTNLLALIEMAVCDQESRHLSDSLWLHQTSPETKGDRQTAVQHISQIPSS